MKTERLDALTASGRRVAVWRSLPDSPRPGCPVAVLNAGFARRMRDVGGIALSLVRNGAIVYRFDSIDHLGLSDGPIADFGLTAMTESLRAAAALARAEEDRDSIQIIALSLANLAAYRVAALDGGIDRIMAISGVVNGLRTLETVLGQDYSKVPYDDLPERVRVLGHDVDPRPLWHEAQDTRILAFADTVDDLKKIAAPIANCIAMDDPWVDIEDCNHAFAEGDGGERLIIKLPYSGHDLGRNPVAVTTILERMAKMVVSPPTWHDVDAESVTLPGFDELLELRVAERDREMSEQTTAPEGAR